MRGTWDWPAIDCWILRHSSSWAAVTASLRSRICPMSTRGGADRAWEEPGPGGGGGIVISRPRDRFRDRIDNTQNAAGEGTPPRLRGESAEVRREMGRLDPRPSSRRERPLHDEPELAHVARPGMRLEPPPDRRVDVVVERTDAPPAERPQEVVDEPGQVAP